MENDVLRTYSQMSKLKTIEERYEYLKLDGSVGIDTFGFNRHINQAFYTSPEWRKVRDEVILRDNGCDLGVEGYSIGGKIVIHHMNPVMLEDILDRDEDILDPEYLVCVSHRTHEAIHYGSADLLPKDPIERKPGDTCPWK